MISAMRGGKNRKNGIDFEKIFFMRSSVLGLTANIIFPFFLSKYLEFFYLDNAKYEHT